MINTIVKLLENVIGVHKMKDLEIDKQYIKKIRWLENRNQE